MTETLIVEGGRPLAGSVRLGAYKHAVLPMLAASLLTDEAVELLDAPRTTDVLNLADMLRGLGGEAVWSDHSLRLRMRGVRSAEVPAESAGALRASYLLMPALLARCGGFAVGAPGGCRVGTRPKGAIFDPLIGLGATVEPGPVHRGRAGRLRGADLSAAAFPAHRTTFTKSALLAAVLARGRTMVREAHFGPETTDLVRFLKTLGARIEGEGTDTLVIEGVARLHGGSYRPMPDLLEQGAWLVAAAITRGHLDILGARTDCWAAELEVFDRLGVTWTREGAALRVNGDAALRGTAFETGAYPAVCTDMHPLFAAAMCMAEGESAIRETIYDDRFAYVSGLRRLGARIGIRGDRLRIRGVPALCGARVAGPDIRGSMALVLAALGARGTSEVAGFEFVRRGHEGFEEKLRALGARVEARAATPIKEER